MKSDEVLVTEALAGQKAAWEAIYVRHAVGVRRLCQGFATLSEADVQDAVQDTFIRAHQRLGGLRDSARLRPWLLTIARSRALNRLARRGSEHRAMGAYAADPARGARSPRSTSKHSEMRDLQIKLVREIIDGLPEGPEKQTVELFYREGKLTAREIAEQLGVGKSTVTMRLERFRARIKRRLIARVARLTGDEALDPTG